MFRPPQIVIRSIFANSKAFGILLTVSKPGSKISPLQQKQQQRFASTMSQSQQFMRTSGANDPVWIHTEPYDKVPKFPQLNKDVETDVCIIGSGIAGVSTAYELVRQNVQVTMIEARDMLSGETGRTSGHLSSDLDEGYSEIVKKHGKDGARAAAESHDYALHRVGEIAKELNIDCEYRQLPAYNISQYQKGEKGHEDDIKEMKEDIDVAKKLGLDVRFEEGFKVTGWDGQIDQRDAGIFQTQATFHPTKYVNGILEWLKQQPNFAAYSRTRALSIEESGVTIPVIKVHLGARNATVTTDKGHKISAAHVVEATNAPLQKLSLIVEMEYHRTYCIAIRVPKGSMEDCMIYDQADPYIYLRLTACDAENDYIVIGGCDHKVGQEDEQEARYAQLEKWVRDRFTKATTVDYKWSGQILEPVDGMAFIGRNSNQDRVYVVTGDYGNGLTHGVLAGKILSDLILGKENKWAQFYDPNRRTKSIIKSAPDMLAHDVQVNMQYKRVLQSDISDIEDLGRGQGGVLNTKTSKPVAVYKDEDGKVHRFSAFCPHLKGVVCWNKDEKSWDCPIHGSRFSALGTQVMGPSKGGLNPEDGGAERVQKQEQGVTA